MRKSQISEKLESKLALHRPAGGGRKVHAPTLNVYNFFNPNTAKLYDFI